jgi:hypothetical protein
MGNGNIFFNVMMLIIVIVIFVTFLSYNQPTPGNGIVQDSYGAFNIEYGSGLTIQNGKLVTSGPFSDKDLPPGNYGNKFIFTENGYEYQINDEKIMKVSKNEVTIHDGRKMFKIHGVTNNGETVTLTKNGGVDIGILNSFEIQPNKVVLVNIKVIGVVVSGTGSIKGTSISKQFDFLAYSDSLGNIQQKSLVNDNVISFIDPTDTWDIDIVVDTMEIEVQTKGNLNTVVNWVAFVDYYETDSNM